MPTPQDISTPACHCCGRPLYGQATRTTCRGCERRINERLDGIAGYYHDLPDFLTPGQAAADTVVRSAPGSRPPLNLHVLNLLGPGGIADMLGTHEDAWRQQLGWEMRPWRGSPDQTLPGVLQFLTVNLLWACSTYEYVDDLDRDLASLYTQSKAIVTGQAPRTVRVSCLARYDDGTVCGAEMRIDVWAPSVKCRSCEARYTREEWMDLYEVVTANAA